MCSAILCNRAMYCSHRSYKWITVTSVRLGWQLTRTQPWCSSKKVSMPTQEIFYDGKKRLTTIWGVDGGVTVPSQQHAEWQFTCAVFGKTPGNSCAHMSQSGITGNKHSSSYALTATLWSRWIRAGFAHNQQQEIKKKSQLQKPPIKRRCTTCRAFSCTYIQEI